MRDAIVRVGNAFPCIPRSRAPRARRPRDLHRPICHGLSLQSPVQPLCRFLTQTVGLFTSLPTPPPVICPPDTPATGTSSLVEFLQRPTVCSELL